MVNAELPYRSAVLTGDEEIVWSNGAWQEYFRNNQRNNSREISQSSNLREVSDFLAAATSLAGGNLYEKLHALTGGGTRQKKAASILP